MQKNDQDMHGKRLLAVDALRGLIIVLMALDHANYFVAQQHSPGEYWGGSYPVYHEFLPFFIRYVTHICAPGFFLLMGIAMSQFAFSRRQRGWTESRIRRHFWIRGSMLILLQFLVVNRAWELSPGGWGIQWYFGVLYALGFVMILGSFFLRMGSKYLIAVMIIILLGVELLVPDPSEWGSRFTFIQYVLLFAGGDPPVFWVNYSALAWLELGLLGLLVGRWNHENPEMAFKRVLTLGVVLLIAFSILRALDGFGNIRPRLGEDWMDFLNPVKYPPSLTYTFMTTGINLILLSFFTWLPHRWREPLRILAVYGTTPLFFYLTHLFLYAGMGIWITPSGANLPIMLLYWMIGLIILYPLCNWYAKLKTNSPSNSLIRLV